MLSVSSFRSTQDSRIENRKEENEMTMTLSSLCKYAGEKYDLRQISGENSRNRLVSWVHRLENETGIDFLNGQELVFCTGVGHQGTDWLLNFILSLDAHHASGLVIKLGPEITSLPEKLLLALKEVSLPVFTIPKTSKLVEITEDFCRKLVKSEENEITVSGAFRNAIFSPEKLNECRSVLERNEFDTAAEFCMIALCIEADCQEHYDAYDRHLRMHLSKILAHHSERFNLFRHDKVILAILQGFPQKIVDQALKELKEICNQPGSLYRVRSGVSINETGIKSLHRSHRRAVALLKMAERQGVDQFFYDQAGLYQLLLEIEDSKTLKRFYKQTLGKLAEFDEKNDTDYAATLKCYLEHNASVMETARELYVHRNTINYKIKRVKEILGCELTYQDALKLLLSYHIKEILY